MARTAVRLLFVAFIALLATQAAMPSVRVVTPVEAVWMCREARQETDSQPVRQRTPARLKPVRAKYLSLFRLAPDTVLFFQLPPPAAA